MAVETHIARGSFFVGANQQHRLDITTSAGAAQTMTGWSLAYVWRNTAKARVVSKATSAGITIGNGSGTDDRATVQLDPADTAALPPGRYDWALWRSDSTNDVPLAFGTLELTRAAAQ